MNYLRQASSSRYSRVLPLAAVALLLGTSTLDAQVTTGLTQAATELTKYLPLVRSIIYALAGLVFLVGAISIFIKMSNGEQNVKGDIMMYVGGVLFLLLCGAIAPTLFR